MSKHRWTLLAIGLFAVLAVAVWSRWPMHVEETRASGNARAPSQAAGRYGVGRQLSEEEIARHDLTVFPSGAGLPKGRGDVEQGQRVYSTQCAACHGERGEGRGPLGPPLAGGIGSLQSDKPQLTVGSYWSHATTVFDYTRRAMPYQAPGSLRVEEVYAVTAYVLYLNGIVGKEQVLDEKSLPLVKMPNRDGFIRDPRPDTHGNAVGRSIERALTGLSPMDVIPRRVFTELCKAPSSTFIGQQRPSGHRLVEPGWMLAVSGCESA